MKGQHENGYQQEMNGNVMMDDHDKHQEESCPTCAEESTATTNDQNNHNNGGSQFITRFISIPLIQESLSNTQLVASQYKLGRFLLDQTHAMVRRLNVAVHKTKETSTFQNYFRQDGYLQRSLVKMDGWACSSLDAVEARVPLMQQPTASIVHTLVTTPRQRVHATWTSVVTVPLTKMNDKINKDWLDGVERWMQDKDLVAPSINGDDGVNRRRSTTSVPRRLYYLGDSAARTMLTVGKNRASYVKEKWIEWTKQHINDPGFFAQPLLSDKVAPMIKSLQSHLDSTWSQWMNFSAKPEPSTL